MFTRINHLFSPHIPCRFVIVIIMNDGFFLFLLTFLPSEGSVVLPRIMFFVNKINLYKRLKSEPRVSANLLKRVQICKVREMRLSVLFGKCLLSHSS